jgi:hypothetical protein
MSMRARAIALGALTAVLTVLALVFQATGGQPDVAETLMLPSFAALGLLLALRVPGNALGWLFLGTAALNSFASAAASLLYVARDEWHMIGLAKVAALASSWQWFAFIGVVVTFCLLLFPDGRLPSPRWRWVARVAAGTIAIGCLALFFMTLSDLDLAVADTDADEIGPVWLNVVLAGAWFALLASAVASLASLIVRWRRAAGPARQQLKWFLLGGLFQLVGIAAGFFTHPVATFVAEISILALPGAAVLAILRYRLYDIDRILSRTLAYTLLTALLLGLYLGGVTVLTAVTAPVTGESPLAVAVATLLAAAAFGPARRRIQSAVDHRFNRAGYDAALTADAYRARLRDQLDLETIGEDLMITARSTVQPSTALLWLRTPDEVQR